VKLWMITGMKYLNPKAKALPFVHKRDFRVELKPGEVSEWFMVPLSKSGLHI
jgi:hypothetical protein